MSLDNRSDNKPVIAVLAQNAKPDYKKSYIAASYVKFLEASGALVVPIPASMIEKEVNKILQCVNGVLLPGGAASLTTSKYFRNVKHVYRKALEAKEQHGDHFPIWGTCLGLQALHVIVSEKQQKVVTTLSAENTNLHLEYTNETRDSRLFGEIPEKLYQTFQNEKLTFNQHKYGISPNAYQTEKKLRDFFRIISLNDGIGGKFISAVEARDYPIYAVQWHPEKHIFENYFKYDINQSPNAIEGSQYFGNFFVNEARKSKQTFNSREDLHKYLIYNHNPVFTGNGHEYFKHFEQVYIFD